MKNIAVINAVNATSYLNQPLRGSQTAWDLVWQYTRNLPALHKVYVLNKKGAGFRPAAAQIELIERKTWATRDFLLFCQKVSEPSANIVYYYADCPFLDSSITERMLANHASYYADYSFADGYPYGLTPEILRVGVLDTLLNLEKDEGVELERGSLFEIIKKDINTFDIETEIAAHDQRLLRLSLCTDTRRNYLLVKNLLEQPSSDCVTEVIAKNPQLLRTLPAFFNLQIVDGCPQNCVYCPYPEIRGRELGKKAEMAYEDFSAVFTQISDFAGDGHICFSLWGEPSYHSRITEMAHRVLNQEGFQLIIETSGLGWREDILSRIREGSDKMPIWLVSLDAWSEEVYRSLRGDGFNEVQSFVEKLQEYFPDNFYLQAVRMKENEDDLENFYRGWKKRNLKPLVQKYDSFSKSLADRMVADLSPLNRFPCWHLKRDMYVFINGDVPMCREDLKGEFLGGNLLREDIKTIWERGFNEYQSHINENYHNLCRNCDEYYTFNF